MTEKRQSAAVQQGPGTEPMAIGEFDGAATLPGDSGTLLATPMYWLYEMGHAALNPVARLRRRHQAVLQKSGQSARAHRLRQVGRRGDGIVRALDAPLSASRNGASTTTVVGGEHVPVHIKTVWERPFCRLLAFRARLRRAAAPAAAEAADRRADVGPLRDAAARHGRGLPAQSRRLHHRLGRRAHGAAGARAASISTTTSTTSSRSCTCSAATRMSSRCASRRCRCWPRSR